MRITVIDKSRVNRKRGFFYVRECKKTQFKPFDCDEWMTPWAVSSNERRNSSTADKHAE